VDEQLLKEIKGRHAVDRLTEIISQENIRTTLSECLLRSGNTPMFYCVQQGQINWGSRENATENETKIQFVWPFFSYHIK